MNSLSDKFGMIFFLIKMREHLSLFSLFHFIVERDSCKIQNTFYKEVTEIFRNLFPSLLSKIDVK